MKKYLHAIIIFTFICCKQKVITINSNQEEAILIKINNHQKTGKSLVDFVSDFSFLTLKNIPFAEFISNVNKVIYNDNLIYILDSGKSNLLVFDIEGNYIKKIGNRGNGPGEYNSIHDFVINKESKKITILDSDKISLLKYNLDGDFLKKIKFSNFFPKKIELINNANYILYTSYSSNEFFDLVYTDLNGKITGYGFKYPKNIDPISFAFTGGVRNSNKSILYSASTSSQIYQIDENFNSKIKYKVEFESNSWPESKKFELHKFDREVRRMNLSFLQNNFYENNEILHFKFTDKKFIKNGYYDLKSKKVYNTDSFNRDGIPLFFNNISGFKNGYLIGSFNPQYFNGISERYPDFKSNLIKLDSVLFNELDKKSDTESNPILIIYNFSFNE